MKATSFSSSISANLYSSGEANGRNSQIFGQAMKKRPTGHYKSIHTSRGETLHLLPAAGWGAVSLIRQLREREHCSVAQIPGRRGAARAAHAQFYHVTVRRVTKDCVQHCQSICSYKASANNTFSIHYNVHLELFNLSCSFLHLPPQSLSLLPSLPPSLLALSQPPFPLRQRLGRRVQPLPQIPHLWRGEGV